LFACPVPVCCCCGHTYTDAATPTFSLPRLCCAHSSEAVFFKKPNDARQIVLGGYVLTPTPSRATVLVKKNVNLIRKFIAASHGGVGLTGLAMTAAAGAAVAVEDVTQSRSRKTKAVGVDGSAVKKWGNSSRPGTSASTASSVGNAGMEQARLRHQGSNMNVFLAEAAGAQHDEAEAKAKLVRDAATSDGKQGGGGGEEEGPTADSSKEEGNAPGTGRITVDASGNADADVDADANADANAADDTAADADAGAGADTTSASAAGAGTERPSARSDAGSHKQGDEPDTNDGGVGEASGPAPTSRSRSSSVNSFAAERAQEAAREEMERKRAEQNRSLVGEHAVKVGNTAFWMHLSLFVLLLCFLLCLVPPLLERQWYRV